MSLTSEPPITHCFENADNSSSVQFWSSDYSKSSLGILDICNTIYCLPKIRLCSANELPTDMFFKKVGPIGFLLLLIGLCSAACLQILGSYYDLFQWSRNIVHLSLLHDFLRNSNVLSSDEIVVEMNQMIWRELKNDRQIVNKKDHLYGDTCLHAALDSDSYEFIEKMSNLGFPDFWIENTFGEDTFRLLEERERESKKIEERKMLNRILLNLQNKEKPGPKPGFNFTNLFPRQLDLEAGQFYN